jgi:bifunctional UDP-N-acetylglucosamine pyrophosphorylase/glucosamine-1-phosphate N-acetyltransferase
MRAAIILAAGQGTRMKSALPKVLHPILNRPMVQWVVDAARSAGASPIVVVVGYGAEGVRAHFAGQDDVVFAVQEQQLGTGDAVRAGLSALPDTVDSIFVLCGDVPLIPIDEMDALVRQQEGHALSVLTFKAAPPHGYGRMLRQGEQLVGIVEAKDATPEQLSIDECNSGTYCFDAAFLRENIENLGTDNAQGEFYLTDLVAAAGGSARGVVAADPARLAGANDRVDLAALTKRAQGLVNDALMRQGVTFEDPETTWVDVGVTVGQDTVLAPGVRLAGATVIGSGCRLAQGVIVEDSSVADGAQIHAYSILESARVESACSVGPFARLRPGAELHEGARVGNYVEVKKATLGKGAKANHLAYIGDAQVGAGANIGAGTITCNYDGANKHLTQIGTNSFVGSNSTLVAPVEIEDNAYVGAGSIVTRTVPEGALGVARAKQRNIEGWVARAAPKKDK